MPVRFRGRQGGRRVDLVLGLLLLAGVLTGLTANTIGVNWPLDLIQLHAAAALAILLISPWKYVVVRRGLRRTRRGRPIKTLSLTLAAFVLITIASGLIHSTGHLEYVGPLSLMQIHVGAAVGALGAVVAHFLTHAVRPRRTDADRRALLGLAVLGAGAAAATAAWDNGPATERRFTGSIPKTRLIATPGSTTAPSASIPPAGRCGSATPPSTWALCWRCRTSGSPRSWTAPAAGTAVRSGTACDSAFCWPPPGCRRTAGGAWRSAR